MTPDDRLRRYQDLQRYVGWTDDDALRVQSVAGLLEPCLAMLVDDFYAEINLHPGARKVITGGEAQIARLKGTLQTWMRELMAGPYDSGYVERRWRVGWRHVEIGLEQVYTNVALSRLRRGLLNALADRWIGDLSEQLAIRQSLNTLMDLDLAIIEDAYQAEAIERQHRAERMATIGQVGGGVAHELRNPLNVVKTSVYYLLNARNPTPEKREEHLRRIERHVTMADNVITALSNFARVPVPNCKSISVSSVVEDAIEANPPPENVSVVRAWPADSLNILADADQMQIVFANLIRNAREAMPQGGTLTFAGQRKGEVIEVTVTDTGIGIPRDQMARIMEPLYTTKARGLGLGLALSRAIVEKNRGTLLVASEPGRGTTFTLRLTVATGDEQHPKQTTE